MTTFPITNEAAPRLSSRRLLEDYKLGPASTDVPDAQGYFGPYGGVYVPETLMAAVQQLSAEYDRARRESLYRQPAWHFFSGQRSPAVFTP